jgi:serine phosphatase RsbU (regulator of sigma subunit)
MKRLFLLLVFILSALQISFAQNKIIIDSLKNILQLPQHDTSRIKILYELVKKVSDRKIWPVYNQDMLKLTQSNLKKSDAKSTLHTFYLKYYASALNNVGFLAYLEGDVPKSLENYYSALKIQENLKYEKEIATSLNNIASVYNFQGEYDRALEYYIRSLEIRKKLHDKIGITKCLNNISLIYLNSKNLIKAEEYSELALKAEEEIEEKVGISYTYNNLGVINEQLGDTIKALDYFFKAYKIEPRDSRTLINIATIYYKKDSLQKAYDYCFKGLQIAKEGLPVNLRNGAQLLKAIYKKQQKPAEALEMYELFIKMRDSINNDENKKLSIKTQFQYDYEKKELLIKAEQDKKDFEASEEKKRTQLQFEFEQQQQTLKSEKEKRELAFNENLKRIKLKEDFDKKKTAAKAEQDKIDIENREHDKQQRFIIFSIAGGLLLVAVFAVFMYRRFKITQKQKYIIELQKEEVTRQKTIVEEQKQVVEEQKHLVEEHQKEIIDSINYAERIQRSFIATKEILNENLNDYFVFFKPKDIVSGDFYWASKLNNGYFALVTADSTGHGVPGAIMSLLNVTSLEKAIETHTQPEDILNATRKTIIERLKKDGSAEGGKDGMDASLTVYDFTYNKLTISAANNPVWIVRGAETIEIKPDKMPVGKHDKQAISFTQQEIDLQTGDVIYTLTDGFPDQFGGEKGKKFMSKNLRELLAANAHLPMQEQKALLEKTFKNWVGNLEQVDDVTLIGVRV